jgi:hypothetical protein
MEAKLHQPHRARSPDRKNAPRYLLSLGLATLALLVLSGCTSTVPNTAEPGNRVYAFSTLMSPSNSVEVFTEDGGVSRENVGSVNPSCDVARKYLERYQYVSEVCDTVDQMVDTLQPDADTVAILNQVPKYTFFLPNYEFDEYCEPQATACTRNGIVYDRNVVFSEPGNEYLQIPITVEEATHVVQQLESENFTLPLKYDGSCVVIQDGTMYIVTEPNHVQTITNELPAALVTTAMDPINGSSYINQYGQETQDAFRTIASTPSIAKLALQAYNSQEDLEYYLSSLGMINPKTGNPLSDGVIAVQTLNSLFPPVETAAHISPPTTCSNP